MPDPVSFSDVVLPDQTSPAASGPVPLSDVDVNPETGRPRITVRPHDDKFLSTIEKSGRAQLAEFENQGLGSAQFTVPDVKSHQKNLMGTAMINDSGEIGWADENGNFNPTDSAKHVVLKDPDDDTYKVFKRTEETNEGPIRGRLLGLGRLLAQGFATSAPGQLAAAGEGGTAAAAAARQGIDLPRGVASPIDATQSRAILMAKTPWVGQNLREAAGNVAPQIESRLDQIAGGASSTGDIMTPAESGALMREGIQSYVGPGGKLSSDVDTAFGKVDQLISPDAVTNMPKTRAVVNDLLSKYAQSGLAQVTPEGEIIPRSKAVQILRGPLKAAFQSDQGGFDYNSTKFLRTYLGKMIENPGEYAEGLNEQEFKQFYGALSDDLRDLIQKSGGQKAVDAWEQAQQVAKDAGERRRALDTIIGSAARSDEGLIGKVQSLAGKTNAADIQTLSRVKQALKPSDWQDVSASIINKLGQGKQGFDPMEFARNFGSEGAKGGLSEEGKNLLFGPKGTQFRNDLEDIAAISRKYPNAAKIAQAGGHGPGFGTWIALMEGAEELRGLFHGESPEVLVGKAALAIPAALGSRIYANFLSRPAGARAIARWMNAVDDVQKTPGANVAKLNNAAQAVIGQLRSNVDTNREPVIQSMESVLGGAIDYLTK